MRAAEAARRAVELSAAQYQRLEAGDFDGYGKHEAAQEAACRVVLEWPVAEFDAETIALVDELSGLQRRLCEQFDALLDVTLVYPQGTPSFWDLLCGRLDAVVVRVQRHEIPAELVGLEQATGRAHVVRLGRWTEQLWKAKDQLIDDLLRAG